LGILINLDASCSGDIFVREKLTKNAINAKNIKKTTAYIVC